MDELCCVVELELHVVDKREECGMDFHFQVMAAILNNRNAWESPNNSQKSPSSILQGTVVLDRVHPSRSFRTS